MNRLSTFSEQCGVVYTRSRALSKRSAVPREEMSNEWEEALQIEHEWGTGISSLLHSNEEIEILHQTWHIGRMLLEYSEHRLAGLVCVRMCFLAYSLLYYTTSTFWLGAASFEQVNLVKRNLASACILGS